MSNQFIHADTSFVSRNESRNRRDVYVVSDFDRKDCIWRVPVSVIRELFKVASDDYPSKFEYKYDAAKDDYAVVTD